VLVIAGCSGIPAAPPPPADAVCESGTTLVCAYRMGKPDECSCKSEDALREIFDRGKRDQRR